MIELRPYQKEAVAAIYDYFAKERGNPLIVLPTGAGKSLTLAAFIRDALAQFSDTRIIVLTHVKELIEQDARAIIRYWPGAPIGIWSAGLNQKTKHQITVAGIQSIHRLPATFAGTDIVIIDEAHLLSKKSDTMYGRFLAGLRQYNPYLKVVGLTATPYRMDSGLLTEGSERVFTDIAYDANVGDLIKDGYLCPLTAKGGVTKADLSQVRTKGGEFLPGDLQAAMDREELLRGTMQEIEGYAHDRQHILGFCAGVEHAKHFAEFAAANGWAADYVTGDMAASDRDARISAFKSGRTRILFNAMLLTTGFDYPEIDCIALMRPTKSTGLYVQMLGRGLRKAPNKENTLVLDFAGNIERHGPIDQIRVRGSREGGEGVSVAPAKECPQCHELIHASIMLCPGCGYEWPTKPKHGTEAADGVIVAALAKPLRYAVDRVEYRRHKKEGRPDSVRVTYWCGASSFDQWIPIEDERSNVKKLAVSWFWKRGAMCPKTVTDALALLGENKIPAPDFITVKRNGKYWEVIDAEITTFRVDVSSVIPDRSLPEWAIAL